VYAGTQKYRDDRRMAQVLPEQVALDEPGFPGQTHLTGGLLGFLHELGDDLDSYRLYSISLCSGEDDSTVSRAEVEQDVARFHFGRLQHCVHKLLRSRDIGNIRVTDSGGGA